ncbi:MAG: acyl-CoA synthetase, partial [Myxococcales bacterium]
RLGRTVAGQGLGLAGVFGAAAVRFPGRAAVIDERGTLTYRELDERANALADSLAALGVGEGDGVALLARNHRGFIETAVAATRLGADVLLLNTSFAAPQLREVCEREGAKTIVFDLEFSGIIENSGFDAPRMLSWVEDGATVPEGVDTVEAAIARGSRAPRKAPRRLGKTIILTSGTTGTPKGAARGAAHLDVPVGLLERIPYRAGMVVHDAAPLFHFWGLSQYQISLLLGNTVVLTRRFDPTSFLETLREHRCDAAVVIPVMLQRVLALPEATRSAYSLPDLKVVAASGSALPGELAVAWMDAFGDNLYNTYGSTEVSLVTIATPADMRALPGTSGRAVITSTVRLFDADGRDVPQGETGRIFAGNSMLFEGYTGGGNKEVLEGLMSTGDIGRFDDAGRLFIEGRDDEMIVSGGENVFPKEVEDCLARHERVLEVAAVGVEDSDFGKRLRAFVVVAEGQDVTEDELRDWVKGDLARYKVPRE